MNNMNTNLPNSEKKLVLTYLFQECNNPAGTHMAAIASTLKNRLGINWKEYTDEVAGGFGSWLCQNFPVKVMREDMDGVEQSVVYLLFSTISEYCADIVVDAMGKNKKILKAQIPAILESRGVKWQEHAGGKKLGDWLTDNFAFFKNSEDNYSICLRGEVPEAEDEAEEEYAYPIVLDVAQEDLEEEIRQMHTFAFMGWWSNNTRKLRQYTGYKGNEESVWREIIAHQMAEAFVGVAPTLLDASMDEEPRIAFDTGMKTEKGEKLYCVFSLNPRNVNGTMQPWIMLGFCYPGEEEENGLGKWLVRRFGIDQENKTDTADDYLQLKDTLLSLEKTREELKESMASAIEDVTVGHALRNAQVTESLSKYNALWADVDKLVAELGWEIAEEQKKIQFLAEKIATYDNDVQQLKLAAEAFVRLADGVQEFFDKYHIDAGEPPVTQKDKEKISSLSDAAVFAEILSCYKSLHQVMTAPALTEEVDIAIDRVCKHFEGVTYRTASKLLVDSEPQECENFGEIRKIEQYLENSNVAKVKKSLENSQSQYKVTAEELLDAATIKGYEKEWDIHTLQIYPENELEKQIIANRGQTDKGFSQAYTHYAVGNRLYAAVGNQNRTAEKFFLLGLCRKDYRCVSMLLNLYRDEKRGEAFGRIWECFGKYAEANIENQIYMLEAKSKESYEELREYLASRPYLTHMEETLPVIIRTYKEQGLTDISLKLEARLEKIQERGALNEFEQLVVACDKAGIKAWADKPDKLVELGYAEREIRQLVQTAASENYATGSQDYEIGVRILAFQGNRNCVAEQYLWRGLAVGSRGGNCVELMGILVDGQRWEECCELYKVYAGELSSEGKCRQYYLLALLHTSPKDAMDFIRENLQDYLILEQGTAEVKMLVTELTSDSDDKLVGFYQNLLDIGEILSDDFTRSVVLLDRRLRDFVTQREHLLELGIATELVERSSVLYKSDAYPHGADTVSIAQRVYEFVGTFKGIAEAIARFALPDYNAASLLWEIYASMEEEAEQYLLLQEYPMLRESHWESYAAFLFKKGQYVQFLEVCEGKEEKGLLVRVQELIACLKTKEEAIILPEFGAGLMQLDTDWVLLLLKELASAKRLDDVKEILFTYFDDMLSAYEADTMKQIACADGILSDAELTEMQEDALAKGYEQVAIYYYKELNVGAIGDVAENFYQQEISRCEDGDKEERIAILQRLHALYRERAEELSGRISLLEIAHLLKNGIDLKQDAQAIADILKEGRLTREDVSELFTMLEEELVARDVAVYSELAQLCEKIGMDKEGLVFFHKLAMQMKPVEAEYGNFICEIYMAGLLGDYLPLELLEEAIGLCYDKMKDAPTNMAAFCLYRMELMRNHIIRAAYALRFLADQQEEGLGESFYQIVNYEIKTRWEENLPGTLELFGKVLNESDIEAIEEYCRFCHYFVGDIEQVKVPENLEDKSLLSEMESVEALKLLFADYDNAEYWGICAKLPLQNDPVAYTKLLYVAGTHNPRIWKECVAYCEKHQQDELLLSALIEWSENPYFLKECRSYLEEQITRDENYLKRWEDEETKVLRLVEMHCSLDCSAFYVTEKHAALRAIVVVAVSSGISEALTMLYDKQGTHLFGEEIDLSMVAVSYLLLNGKIEEAYELIQKLDKAVSVMKYRKLVDKLAAMTVDQLREWVETDNGNRSLLTLVLPDGNAPDLARIHQFVLESIQQDNVKLAAQVLSRLLKIFPQDYGCHDSLFVLCKTDFEGRMELLHRSIRSLICHSPGDGKTYYPRTKQEYAAMLAAINGVLIGREAEVPDYDFGMTVGDFCRKELAVGISPVGISDDDVSTLTRLQEDVSRLLENRSPEEHEKLSKAILCQVTGEWTDFLLDSWKNRIDVAEALSLQLERNAVRVNDKGFARSVLRILTSLSDEEQRSFVGWLDMKLSSDICTNSHSKHRQMKMVHFVLNNGVLEKINNQEVLQQILKYPVEEYSMFMYCYKTYIKGALNEDAEQIYARAVLIGLLADYYAAQKEFWQTAKTYFEDEKDSTAIPLFAAMYDLARNFKIIHEVIREENNAYRVRQVAQEKYEIYYRLSKWFVGDKEMRDKISSPEFNSWSCVNLAMGLMYTPRADKVLQYSTCLAPENKRLIEGLLKGIDATVSDEEKISVVRSLSDDMARAILAYIFKYYNRRADKYYFIQKEESARILNDIYLNMEYKCPNDFRNHSIVHCIWVEPFLINGNAYRQMAPVEMPVVEVRQEIPEEVGELIIPAFAQGLEPIKEEVDLRKLREEYERIPSISMDNRRDRVQKAEQIYRVMLGGNYTLAEKIDILTCFGVDYYYAHATGNVEELRLANQALKEVVMLQKHGQTGGAGSERLEKMVRETALHELLHKGYGTLTELLEDYGKYKSAFKQMQKMITDPVTVDCILGIYQVIDSLMRCYSTVAESDAAGLRNGLQNAYSQLENISNQSWYNVKNVLQMLIREDVNALDERPVLHITVLNKEPGKECGNLFGLVRNKGRVEATQIVLQAHYGDNTTSRQYALKSIAPDDEAVFAIDYSVEPDTTMLEYSVSATYKHGEKLYNADVCKGSIVIDENVQVSFPSELYDTDTVGDFEADEQGNITSPNFFGRDEETKKLRELFTGKKFVNYHSTILYGVRRGGKTSLLNYIKKYTECNCPEAVTIYVSCQGITDANCIQYIFVDKVIQQVQAWNGELEEDADWLRFVAKWTLPKDSREDRDPNSLELFYRGLKKVIGKGLIFLIDEIDWLFDLVENKKQLDSNLFPALGTMLCSADCRESVQFILCGSRWLLSYRKQDGELSQLFQRLGKRVTEVGRMPEKDMVKMLEAPCKEYPELKYTDEALKWLWDYTGGMVWHTKMLAQSLIDRIREEGRNVIYPFDVCAEVTNFINDGSCQQFFEGCKDNELLVLGAMQSLAYKRGRYISLSQIYDLFGGNTADRAISQQEIDQALSMLCELRLIEKHPASQPKYRFTVEIYRIYFRIQNKYTFAFEQKPETERMFLLKDAEDDLYADELDF